MEPTFDMSNLSWKDSKALAVQQMRLKKAQEDGDPDALEAGFLGMERFIARVLVDVPRGWLVSDAPAQIDWGNPDSLNYVRAGRMKDLMAAIGEAQSPEGASLN